jgi:hypothetical protein
MPNSPKPKSHEWESECRIAVVRGDAAAMRCAIQLGLPLNQPVMQKFLDRFTPLQYAVDAGAKPAVVAVLVDAGADVNARSVRGGCSTPP